MDGGNYYVRVLSLDPANLLAIVARQALPDEPEALCFAEMEAKGAGGDDVSLFLFCGLKKGVLIRLSIDATSGSISPVQSRRL
jgi:hypothetical protein